MPAPTITVELKPQADDRIEMQTKTSLTGQSQAIVSPPFSEPMQRQAVALALEAVSFDPSVWQTIPQVFQALKDLGLGSNSGFTGLREGIGTALFEAFFPPGGLREALRANLNAASPMAPARIELTFRAEDAGVSAYPWELLHDPDRGFIFANRRAALIRYVACPLPVPRLLTSDALNLLLVTARPISQPTDPIQLPLLVDAESKAIEDGLAEPLASGAIHLELLPPASPARSTWELLSDYLTTHTGAEAPHILHFDGHGGFGRRCAIVPAGCGLLNAASDTVCRGCQRHLDGPPQGYLAFEARNKRPHWVSAREVSNLLVDAGVRLAVLTACKSAVVAGQSVFSGLGPALIQAGVPAVVAMQFSVTAEAAKSFTRSFYLALAQYAPVTKAMGLARAALFVDETAWYRPVLYLRTDAQNPEGKLFARKSKPKPKPEPPETPLRGEVVFRVRNIVEFLAAHSAAMTNYDALQLDHWLSGWYINGDKRYEGESTEKLVQSLQVADASAVFLGTAIADLAQLRRILDARTGERRAESPQRMDFVALAGVCTRLDTILMRLQGASVVLPPETVVPSPAPVLDLADPLRRILRNMELTEAAFVQQIKRRDALHDQIRSRLGILPGLQWEKFFFQYYDQMTKSELFEFKQIRAITETTLQTRNRDTLSILEGNPALLDAVPRLNDLRTHLTVWVNKYDGLFVSTPEMCVLYVGVEDGVPFPRGIECSIQEWLDSYQVPVATKPLPNESHPKPGEPCPQPTINRTDLRNAIVQYFSREELDVLCADVQADLEARGINEQVSVEMVGGSSKTGIVLNLITYLERRGQLGCLEAVARRMRPNVFQ